jgi:hypothetical protein
MLSISRIADRYRDDSGPPITDKALSTGIEDGFAADCFGSCPVGEHVVKKYRAVAGRKCGAFLLCTFSIWLGWTKFFAFATAFGTFHVLEFKTNNLVYL